MAGASGFSLTAVKRDAASDAVTVMIGLQASAVMVDGSSMSLFCTFESFCMALSCGVGTVSSNTSRVLSCQRCRL